jgi:hypothetical protein
MILNPSSIVSHETATKDTITQAELGRSYIGVELDAKYHAIASGRLARA